MEKKKRDGRKGGRGLENMFEWKNRVTWKSQTFLKIAGFGSLGPK